MKSCYICPDCPYLRNNWFWRLQGRCNHRKCFEKHVLPRFNKAVEECLIIVSSGELTFEKQQAELDRISKIL